MRTPYAELTHGAADNVADMLDELGGEFDNELAGVRAGLINALHRVAKLERTVELATEHIASLRTRLGGANA